MYKTHNSLIDMPSDTVIWRYFDFTSFYGLLLTQSLYFRKLNKFSDRLEGTLQEQTVAALFQHRMTFDYTTEQEGKDWVTKQIKNVEERRSSIFANSWTIDEDESYAMWKIYLRGNKEGVAITSTVGKLKKCLEGNTVREFYSGKVTYSALPKSYNVFMVATNKRRHYKYEKEYRAFTIDRPILEKEQHPNGELVGDADGLSIQVNLHELIERIFVSPFSGDWFIPIVQSAIKQLLPTYDSCKINYSGIQDE